MRLGRNLRTRRRILDGKGHPRPASALRRPLAPATPVSCPTVHSVHRRPTPMPCRSMCLARVGPLLKSVAQSMCQCPAMIPHGTPKVPSCLPTRLHNMPTVRRRPRPTVLANGPPCTAVSASHELDHEVLPRSPFRTRGVAPNFSQPAEQPSVRPGTSRPFCPNVGRPGPTPPVRFPCLSGTLNTPLRCLE
ncbi:UNVERIFIED_CONTAM: hypothetical protein Sradi_0549700 [Sesamum radiatum]|uniref:Uncharacterized protein n=1 Tax=Sesamum radiatum TaxID=300843 RepID=A0AAW2VIC3_SESRA